mmetsp:Transcript_41754/g.67193  ORF Transcript_41754/g.67193 Transcript_41754/m.67193 type:complete len:98 (+) Transcript_41754:466-759(+)
MLQAVGRALMAARKEAGALQLDSFMPQFELEDNEDFTTTTAAAQGGKQQQQQHHLLCALLQVSSKKMMMIMMRGSTMLLMPSHIFHLLTCWILTRGN